MDNFSVSIENYKCFKERAGFDEIRRVNLIIGRNNSGKSALLDVIDHVCNKKYEFEPETHTNGKSPKIIFKALIPKNAVNKVFPSNSARGIEICSRYKNFNEYGQQLIGRNIVWTKSIQAGKAEIQLIECDDKSISPPLKNCGIPADRLLSQIPVPLEEKSFKRILSERNIVPENKRGTDIVIEPSGAGITDAIQRFLLINQVIVTGNVKLTH